MRIIAGTAKGRRLRAPGGPKTRPMTDRAKEAIFSMLADSVVGSDVADLYAGSGSLGLEALSRGAASVVFVESRHDAIAVLEANIAAVGLGGTVVASTVERFVDRTTGAFDLAFVDPPYALAPAAVEGVLARLTGLLADRATVVLHRRHGSGEIPPPERLTLVDQRRYGDAEITRFTREAKA